MTDPKTPEQIVEEARKKARAGHAECFCETTECAIDRLSRVSMLAGRIQQADRDMRTAGQGGGWNHVITGDLRRERDRLLSELNKETQDATESR